VGTQDNGSDLGFNFVLHRVFPPSMRRYLPWAGLRKVKGIALRYDVSHIICEHPYMAPLAIALSKALKVPWILRSHNIEALRFKQLGKPWWRLLHVYEGYAMRSAHAILFITQEDYDLGIEEYDLAPDKCHIAPFGTNLKEIPGGREEARRVIAERLNLDERVPWIYFLGVFNYGPNADAAEHLICQLFPKMREAGMDFELIIAGKGLPSHLQALVAAGGRGLHYAGFVEDLDSFIRACDIMVNPLASGGGIKTKAIEALAYNKIVVSTEHGAAGIHREYCGTNLIVVPDGDTPAFLKGVAQAMERKAELPEAFYQHYNWEAIGKHVLEIMRATEYK
jgi:glycosyltransferase involved in cell wall biosynthesis